jgi:SAM-dependent methyltransferase
LLDVGCGTGLSFIPMLERGWTVTGCDISPEMLAMARSKVGEKANLLEADMRNLPTMGHFDLVWAVDDALNYLLDFEELAAALDGMKRNLKREGIVLFDVNTLFTYRSFFAKELVVEANGRRLIWTGLVDDPDGVQPGVVAEARVEAVGEPGSRHRHRQRHFAVADVLSAIEMVGLRCVEVSGELDGELSSPIDEERHTKVIFVCRHSDG